MRRSMTAAALCAVLAALVTRGYAVAITDYEGSGTPGVHTYTNRASQALGERFAENRRERSSFGGNCGQF